MGVISLLITMMISNYSVVNADYWNSSRTLYYNDYLWEVAGSNAGHTSLKYYNSPSVQSYAGMISDAFEMWYYPKDSNGTSCMPYNPISYQKTTWENSIIDFYATTNPIFEAENALAYTLYFRIDGTQVNWTQDWYYNEVFFNVRNNGYFLDLNNYGVVSKRSTIAHEIGHTLMFYENNYSNTIMAQSSYRNVNYVTCRDNNAVNRIFNR